MNRDALFISRIYIPLLIAILTLYAVLVIAPFFLLNIHQQPAQQIMGGAFDPKGIPPYSSTFGSWLHTASLLTMIAAPIIASITAPVVGLSLRHHWRRRSGTWRMTGLTLVVGSVALLLFVLTSPLAHLIMAWWLD